MTRTIPIGCVFFSLIGISIALVSGCGKQRTPTYPVSGTVTFDDKPVLTGDVLFVPADSKHGPTAGKIHDGQFQFEAIAGPHRVEIRALRPVPGAASVLGEVPQENYLPARYHAESRLTAEVTPAGPNTFEFKLVGGKP